jgi:hypothetical protein
MGNEDINKKPCSHYQTRLVRDIHRKVEIATVPGCIGEEGGMRNEE